MSRVVLESPRVIGGRAATILVVGSMVGIGVFLAPAIVARHVPSVGLYLLLWVAGGLTAFAGASALAELGAMLPRAGGDYVYIGEAYGPSVAFAAGWVLFGGIFAGSIAAVSAALCQFQVPVLVEAFSGGAATFDPGAPLAGLPAGRWLALALLLGLTALHARGTRLSIGVQGALSATAVGALALLALAALGTQDAAPAAAVLPTARVDAGSLALAYLPIYFAFSGWNAVIYVAGEVREPGRALPRALFLGSALVLALYLLLNVAFLRVIGLAELPAHGEAGTALAAHVDGRALEIAVTGVILLALLGSLNVSILGGARVAQSMSERGALVGPLGALSRRGVPARALWLQAAIGGALVVSGTFEQVLALASLAMQVTGALAVGALFVLRRRRPDLPRPYRALGYPWLPLVYLLSALAVLLVLGAEALRADAWSARLPLLGVAAFVLAGLGHRLTTARPRA